MYLFGGVIFLLEHLDVEATAAATVGFLILGMNLLSRASFSVSIIAERKGKHYIHYENQITNIRQIKNVMYLVPLVSVG